MNEKNFLQITILSIKKMKEQNGVQIIAFSDLPQAEIVLGGSLNRSNIREFDDVYFECR